MIDFLSCGANALFNESKRLRSFLFSLSHFYLNSGDFPLFYY